MMDVPPPADDTYGEGLALNNLGHVVGWSGPGWRAFYWSREGGVKELGTFGEWYSWAEGINDLGQVVGHAASLVPKGESSGRSFLWTPKGGDVNLGTIGGSFAGARDINEDGTVGGFSSAADGVPHGLLWHVR
jgi:probable HAF family extracellular repeat protein